MGTKRQVLAQHLKPMFRNLKLDAIGSREIEVYKAEKIRKGFSPKTVNNHLIVLRKLLAVAEEWQLLDRVPRRACVRGAVVTPKSGKPREIPLDGVATTLLRRLPRAGDWVFVNDQGSPLTKGECKHPLWRACRAAGLRRIGWHVLRHTFASHLVMRGAQLEVVQELLGHATVEMTLRYAHLSPEVRKDAVRLLEMTHDKVPTGCQQTEAAIAN